MLAPLATACGAQRQASSPTLPAPQAEVAVRERAYERYALHEQGSFRSRWQRSDGTYDWAQLEELAATHDATRDLHGDAALRDTVLTALLGVGVGILVGTATHELAADDEHEFSSGSATALYVAGGSALGLAVVLRFALPNPKDRLEPAYNAALRQDLGLAAEPAALPP